MEGKVIVVTGANSGIGKEIATYAASKNATVYMLCRSKDRAEAAKNEIVEVTSNANVKVLLADVGETSQVKRAAEELQSAESRIDCLVCNAGVLLNDKTCNSEGVEVTFASHFLGGSYLLGSLLYPQLQAAGKGARVVFVSSGGMYNSKFPKWDVATSQTSYDGNLAYSYAKRGQVLLAERWARDRPDVCWVSCHPGWTNTPAVDLAYGENKKYLEPMRSIWEGAEGITWLMSTNVNNLKSGEFYLDRYPQRKHIAGVFMTDGSFTKNTEAEVDDMMERLKEAAGL
jgi:dehydrogenase/reductase SDR family protein 12